MRRSMTRQTGTACDGYLPGAAIPRGQVVAPSLLSGSGVGIKRQAGDLRLDFLCAFAFLNPLVVQLGFFLAPPTERGALSVPQLFQGCVFVVAVVAVLLSRWRPTIHTARIGRFLVLIATAAAVILFKTAFDHGQLITVSEMRGDLIFFFKIFFWAFMWWLVAIVVRRKHDARRLLHAVLAGAFLTSLIVLVSYVTGAGNVAAYEQSGVMASVGASGVSPKQTVAYLAPCALIAMYLGRGRRPVAALMIALPLVGSTLLTYDRSIQVGMVVASGWLALWWAVLSGRRVSRNWSIGLLLAACVTAVLLFSYVGVDSLIARWTADFQSGRPGSGRLEFYQAASERYCDGTVSDLLVGIGYTGIKETMRSRCGMAIHTHSDFFDLLLGGGLLGVCLYGALYWILWRYWRSVPRGSAESAVMGASLAIYAVMSLITGQLEATHAMFCLGASLHCCHLMYPRKPVLKNRPAGRTARQIW